MPRLIHVEWVGKVPVEPRLSEEQACQQHRTG